MLLIAKLFSLLLKPIIWIIVLFIIAMMTKNPKRKKRLLIASLTGLIFFTNPFIFRIITTSYEAKPVNLTKTYSAGIVLGGFVYIENAEARFSRACDRFLQTALLYKNGNIQKIIFSGGSGQIKEGIFIKNQFIELGIPANDIHIDPYANNTYENAINTSKMCDSLQLKGPFVVITSAIHIPRAKRLFEKIGMNIVSYPTDFIANNRANNFWEDYLVPSTFVLYNWDSLIKEIIGLLVYKLAGKA